MNWGGIQEIYSVCLEDLLVPTTSLLPGTSFLARHDPYSALVNLTRLLGLQFMTDGQDVLARLAEDDFQCIPIVDSPPRLQVRSESDCRHVHEAITRN